MNKEKEDKKIYSQLLFWEILFFVFVSFMFISYFLVRLLILKKPPSLDKLVFSQENKNENKKESKGNEEFPWEVYVNKKFGYSLSHPSLLFKNEFKNPGRYLHFVRFEETNFSNQKGVAVGVSQGSLEEEAKIIKEEFGSDAKLVSEKYITVNGVKGLNLEFEPNNSSLKESEKRAVVIFEKEGWVYSISTVPEQIERVLESFKFL